MDRLGTALEIKQVDTSQRIISGYAAFFGNIDRVDDIIEPTAFKKTLSEKSPSDIAVFIGHQSATLPVGVPIKIESDGLGLHTETKIFEGPVGDNLLAVARGLQAHGQTLGLSIGYRPYPGGSEWTRVDGKSVRKLKSIDLAEYSFAARQTIANPEALMTGVKQIDALGDLETKPYRIRKEADEWCVYDSTGKNRGCSASEDMAKRHLAALYAHETGKQLDDVTLDIQYVPYAMTDSTANDPPPPQPADDTATKGAPLMADLPNSAFFYVEPGDDDEAGLRVPRSKRHFPYRDAEGKIDVASLRQSIASIPDATIPGLDEQDKARLQARARRMLEHDQKTDELDADEWKSAAPALDLLAVAYRLIDTAYHIVDEHKALGRLGEDTKQGRLVRAEIRQGITEAQNDLKRVVDSAEIVARGLEEKAAADWWRAQFDFSEVTV